MCVCVFVCMYVCVFVYVCLCCYVNSYLVKLNSISLTCSSPQSRNSAMCRFLQPVTKSHSTRHLPMQLSLTIIPKFYHHINIRQITAPLTAVSFVHANYAVPRPLAQDILSLKTFPLIFPLIFLGYTISVIKQRPLYKS